ncbi:hypothetical protein G6F22_014478 [Rhizopus arrhizus]|nr:hypothetical protein G6F22_014478 [Rhizopus arrhizus]
MLGAGSCTGRGRHYRRRRHIVCAELESPVVGSPAPDQLAQRNAPRPAAVIPHQVHGAFGAGPAVCGRVHCPHGDPGQRPDPRGTVFHGRLRHQRHPAGRLFRLAAVATLHERLQLQGAWAGTPSHHLPVPQAALLVRSAGGLAVFPGSVRAHPARHFPHPSAAVAAVPAPLAAPGADRSAAGFAHHGSHLGVRAWDPHQLRTGRKQTPDQPIRQGSGLWLHRRKGARKRLADRIGPICHL